MAKNLLAFVSFSHFLGIGPMKFKQLVSYFGNPEKAYQTKAEDLIKVLGPKLGEKFIQFRQKFNPEQIIADLTKKGIQILTLEDNDYPEQLKNISDPPICLYAVGNKKILTRKTAAEEPARLDKINNDRTSQVKNILAIVGTRKPTSYGLQVAEKFAGELAQYGFTVASGMALGIDSAAHWATINNNSKTIAVLGCGVDIVYPPSNKGLYQKIIETGGVVLSEFPPGHTVLPGLFIARNRIISGLSSGVLVVEGAKDSGSLITARFAAEQGRDVFAPPSPITSYLSEAPNMLLKQGAKLVTSVSDILEEYQVKMKTKDKQTLFRNLQRLEKEITEILINEPKTANELTILLNKSIDQILNSLSLLEIQGIIKKNNEGKFYL
jgi:DNA processing protein